MMADMQRATAIAALLAAGLLGTSAWLFLRSEERQPSASAEPETSLERGAQAPAGGLATAAAEFSRDAVAAEAPATPLELATVPVRVRAAETLQRDAAPLGGARVAFGIVCRARGATPRNSALPDGLFELLEGTTGDDGVLAAEVRVPAAWLSTDEAFDRFLWGVVREPGYQRLAREVVLETPPKATALALLARRGATLRGRVVDADGAPVAGVRVRLLEPDFTAEGGLKSTYDDGTTRADGRFAIHHDGAGPRALLALADGRGTAFRADVAFEPDGVRVGATLVEGDAPDAVLLVLAGGGELAGTVVDPAGAPVAGHLLWALPAGWQGPYLTDAQRFERVRGDGLMDGQATTDARGRFAIAGLRPGGYHVWGYDGPEHAFGPRLTDAPAPAGTVDLRLVARRHALVVRVLDHAGRALAPVVAPPWSSTVGARVTLRCAYAGDDGRLDAARAYRGVHHTALADGTVVYEVEPDVPYLVGVVAREHPLQESVVRVPADRLAEVLELHLAPPVPPGTLALHVAQPDGAPFTDTTNVRVRSLASGATLHESANYFHGPDFTAELPPGRYRVDVDVDPPIGSHGEINRATPFTPVALEVTIRAGELSALDVRLGASGRLCVLVHLPDGVAGVPRSYSADVALDDLIRGADLELAPIAGGAPLRAVFDVSYAGVLEIPFHGVQTGKAPHGIEVTSVNPIPVGRYVARLSADGCAPFERELEIRAGEVTRLEAALRPAGR
jgi:hypothetical protein